MVVTRQSAHLCRPFHPGACGTARICRLTCFLCGRETGKSPNGHVPSPPKHIQLLSITHSPHLAYTTRGNKLPKHVSQTLPLARLTEFCKFWLVALSGNFANYECSVRPVVQRPQVGAVPNVHLYHPLQLSIFPGTKGSVKQGGSQTRLYQTVLMKAFCSNSPVFIRIVFLYR